MPKVSIIIRTKNEEYWIRKLIHQLYKQTFQDFEIILVDNMSGDFTLNIFKEVWPQGKIVEIQNFKPGLAINLGIRKSVGELIAIISAHCIPMDEFWLEQMVGVFDEKKIGAVYGRQIPLQTSDPFDKRDLLNTFGIESRVQKKDTFFHNANSMIRRSVWETLPFDEEAPHIEDRIWAEKLIENGYWIAYNADATVYHYHGINHRTNLKRAEAISEILTKQSLHSPNELPEFLQIDKSRNLYCFLGHDQQTDKILDQILEKMGNDYPPGEIILHSKATNLVKSNIRFLEYLDSDTEKSFVDILSEMLQSSSERNFYPDAVVYVNLKAKLINWENVMEAMNVFYKGMYDSVFWANKEYSNVWQMSDNVYHQVKADYTKKDKKEPIYLSRYGLGLVTLPSCIRSLALVGKKVAILPLNLDNGF